MASPVSAASPAGQIDEQIRMLRGACYDAVRALASLAADALVLVGPGEASRSHPASAAGSLRAYGIPVDVGSGEPVLPLALTVGAWLVGRCLPDGGPRPAELVEVARSAPAGDCLELGARLAARWPRVAMLVLGDGTARRALGVPGAADPVAADFDSRLAEALGTADARTLADLDPAEADEVGAAGRVAWQVLAGAALAGPGQLRGRLRYAGAPLDVGYVAASWTA